jgi:membrane-bound ClpP family serine protease
LPGVAGPSLTPNSKTLVVEISSDIDLGLSAFVERMLGDARSDKLVLFHVNTFGGRIDAAMSIRDAILAPRRAPWGSSTSAPSPRAPSSPWPRMRLS